MLTATKKLVCLHCYVDHRFWSVAVRTAGTKGSYCALHLRGLLWKNLNLNPNFFCKKNLAPPEIPRIRMEYMNVPYTWVPYLEHFFDLSLFQKSCSARQKKIANVRCRHMILLIIPTFQPSLHNRAVRRSENGRGKNSNPRYFERVLLLFLPKSKITP